MWNYYSDGVNDSANENIDAMKITMNNNKTKRGQPFDYKKKLVGSTPNNKSRLNAEVVVLLIYFRNFWRSLDLLLITVTAKKKKWSFLLRISPVNMIESTENSGFCHIYWRNI